MNDGMQINDLFIVFAAAVLLAVGAWLLLLAGVAVWSIAVAGARAVRRR